MLSPISPLQISSLTFSLISSPGFDPLTHRIHLIHLITIPIPGFDSFTPLTTADLTWLCPSLAPERSFQAPPVCNPHLVDDANDNDDHDVMKHISQLNTTIMMTVHSNNSI